MANFNFLMSLDQPVRPHADAVNALRSIEGSEDGLIDVVSEKGSLHITCNGKGLRRDLSPQSGTGYIEAILLKDDVVLTLVSITPSKPTFHRIENDPSIYLGMQLISPEELTPSLHNTDSNIVYCGGLGKGSKSLRILREDETFSAISISVYLSPRKSLLNTQISALSEEIDESLVELTEGKTYFTSFQSNAPAKLCVHEMLYCSLSGQPRFDYLHAKTNEFICLLENMSGSRRNEKTSTPQKIAQKDKEALFRVRDNIQKSPGDNLTIPTLASDVGFSPNKLISLFKGFYGQSIHSFVVNVRMNKAKSLLEESDLPVKEICALVGYSDHSGFSRAFKKVYGVSPSKIRRFTAS